MDSKKKNVLIIILIAVIFVLIGLIGYFVVNNKLDSNNSNNSTSSTTTTTTTTTTTKNIKENYSKEYFNALKGIWINCEDKKHDAVLISNDYNDDMFTIGEYAGQCYGGPIINIEYKNNIYVVTFQAYDEGEDDGRFQNIKYKIELDNNILTINGTKYIKSTIEEAEKRCLPN